MFVGLKKTCGMPVLQNRDRGTECNLILKHI